MRRGAEKLLVPTRGTVTAPTNLNSLPAMTAVWSVNDRVLTAYTGPLFRIRRASDSTEIDIGTDASGRCNVVAIAKFCGSSLGSVSLLYDQSGNARDLSQVSASAQPKIYDGTSVRKEGTSVAMLCDSTQYMQRSDACGVVGNPALTVAAIWNQSRSTMTGRLLLSLGNEATNTDLVVYNASRQIDVGLFGPNALFALGVGGYHYDVIQRAAGATLGQSVVRQSGAVKAVSTDNATLPNVSNTGMTLGNLTAVGQTGVNGSYAGGSISTVCLMPYTLTAPQLATLEAWLEERAKSTSLDALGVATAAGWSVNDRIWSSYTGPLFRVRRSSDNTETEIGALEDGSVDRAALLAFCGAGSGYVSVLWDQSGFNRYVQNVSVTLQPRIVNAGALQLRGNTLTMLFDGVNDILSRTDNCGISGTTAFTLAALYSNQQFQSTIMGWPTGSFWAAWNHIYGSTGPGVSQWIGYGGAVVSYSLALTSFQYTLLSHPAGGDVASMTCRVNGGDSAPSTLTNGTHSLNANLFTVGSSYGGNYVLGPMVALFVFTSVLTTAQRSILESWFEARRFT